MPGPAGHPELSDRRLASALLGLDELQVFEVEGMCDGTRAVHVLTAPDVPRRCPRCSTPARRAKERVCTVLRDTPQAQARTELRWHKQRWWCDNPGCARKTFTEAVSQAGPGKRLTARMRTAMAEAVGDQLRPVSEVAETFGVSWRRTHDAFAAHADAVLGAPRPEPSEDGHDPEAPEPDSAAAPEPDSAAAPEPDSAAAPEPDSWPATAVTPDPCRPADPAAAPAAQQAELLPPVSAMGIDDTRRGRRRLRRDRHTGAFTVLADQWQTGFVDISGNAGLLGQTPGRTGRDVIRWLSRQPEHWRNGIQVVAIDMSSTYRNGIRTALPHARVSLDPFHIVQAANKMVAEVRRKETRRRYHRRSRSGDPEYTVKRLLARNKEDLTPAAAAKLWDTLLATGPSGERILAAYIAKEKIRDVLALSPTRTHITPADSQIRHRLTDFFDWCATFENIPEVITFAQTISGWRHELATAVRTGVSNSTSEGTNRIVKLVARIAFGFRNPVNQRRRVRYATTRASRRDQSHPATNQQSPPVIT